jgi:hypothetical protein
VQKVVVPLRVGDIPASECESGHFYTLAKNPMPGTYYTRANKSAVEYVAKVKKANSDDNGDTFLIGQLARTPDGILFVRSTGQKKQHVLLPPAYLLNEIPRPKND